MPIAPNLAFVVQAFSFPGAVTRRRAAGDTINADGLRSRGATTDTPIRAFVHDEPGDVEANAPEGQNDGRTIRVYTTDDLRTVDVDGVTPADVVLWQGQAFEVVELRAWASGPGTETWREARCREVGGR